MKKNEILRRLVDRVIIPKYPFLKLDKIDDFHLSQQNEYDVRFITKKKLDAETQTEIDTEIKNLFTMAGLDDIQKYKRDTVVTWFKAPNGKSWTFLGKPGYIHIPNEYQ